MDSSNSKPQQTGLHSSGSPRKTMRPTFRTTWRNLPQQIVVSDPVTHIENLKISDEGVMDFLTTGIDQQCTKESPHKVSEQNSEEAMEIVENKVEEGSKPSVEESAITMDESRTGDVLLPSEAPLKETPRQEKQVVAGDRLSFKEITKLSENDQRLFSQIESIQQSNNLTDEQKRKGIAEVFRVAAGHKTWYNFAFLLGESQFPLQIDCTEADEINGKTALISFAGGPRRFADEKILRSLLGMGNNAMAVNHVDFAGMTALSTAVLMTGEEDDERVLEATRKVVEVLVRAGAKVHMPSPQYHYGRNLLQDYICRVKTDVDDRILLMLLESLMKEDSQFKYLSHQDVDGGTIFHLAARFWNSKIFRSLLPLKKTKSKELSETHSKHYYHWDTLLTCMRTKEYRSAALQALLLQDAYGQTAIHIFMDRRAKWTMFQDLLNHGLDFEELMFLEDAEKRTLFHYLARIPTVGKDSYLRVLAYFLSLIMKLGKYDWALSAKDIYGWTPIDYLDLTGLFGAADEFLNHQDVTINETDDLSYLVPTY